MKMKAAVLDGIGSTFVVRELDLDKQKLFLDNLPKEHQILMNSALSIEGEHIQMIHLKKE